MKSLKNSSFIYAALALIFTLSIFMNEHFLSSQSQTLETVQLEQFNGSANINQFDLEQKENDSGEQSIEFSEALSFSKLGETEKAIALYKGILVQQPNHQMAAINLVILLKKTQGCKQLETQLQHAIDVSRGKRKAKAHSLFASCLSEEEQYKKALIQLDKSLQFRPNHAATWLKRALVQKKSGLPFPQVLQSYRQALAMDSKNKALRLDVAIFQQKHLDYDGSIKTIKEKFKSLKSSIPANKILAWNYFEVGKINNAKKHANLVKSLQTDNQPASQALIDFLEGNTEQALTKLSNVKKSNAEHHYLLAKIYQKKKWKKHSATQLKKTLKYSKKSTYDLRVAWMMLNSFNSNLNKDLQIQGLINFLDNDIASGFVAYEASKQAKKLGKFKEAKSLMDLARKNTSDKNLSKTKERLYAEILWLNNNKPQAVSHLTELNLKYPTNRSIKRLLGKYLISQNKIIDALAVLLNIKESERNKKDLFTLASLQSRLSKPTQAINNLKELLQRNESHIEGRFLLAQLLLQNDQVKMGKKHLTLLLKLDQHHQAAQKLISKVI